MATDKKKIQVYVDDKTLRKFKVVSATKNKSMSEYASTLVEKSIEGYEVENGEIKLD